MTTNWKFLVAVCVTFLVSVAVDCEVPGGYGEWQMLTKQNFSSQIRLQHHILLVVTLPWSGEARSLMKEISHLVTERPENYSSLRLMFMYRNMEKTLTDAVGANFGETSVIYYSRSISYKYRGRLRAQNILFSIDPYLTRQLEELPLKRLNTHEDLEGFLDSSDRVLLLFEFCGWTSELLAKGINNGTASGLCLQGDIVRESVNRETNASYREKQESKDMDDENLQCAVKNEFSGVPWLGGFSGVPWLGEFSLENMTGSEDTEKGRRGVASSCSSAQFHRFESFFSEFMTSAREFFLPPQKHQFGLVSESVMLSSLGIRDTSPWLAVLYFAGCPNCLKILKDENDLRNNLHLDNPVVLELEGDENDPEPALPGDKPSAILFVDRLSDASDIRSRSKLVLGAFRELALHHHTAYQTAERDGAHDSETKSVSGHPRLKLSPTAQKIRLKDKMSTIMVVNEGKHVTLDKIASDLQGNSLHEIMSQLLRQRKDSKLSVLAKELGFQLLSDDMDIKIVSPPLQEADVQSDAGSSDLSLRDTSSDSVGPEKDQMQNDGGVSTQENMEVSTLSFDEPEKKAYSHSTEQLMSVELDLPVTSQEPVVAEEIKIQERSSLQSGNLQGEEPQFEGFKGSFFFSDGNYRLLRALTGGSNIPSLVIVDPVVQQHYVFPRGTDLSYSAQADFLRSFLNGSLLPYLQSQSIHKSPREAVHPPFVNLDFHETDSIPQVTALTFPELVLGFNQSENSGTLKKDVLVLFSNSWCGFCQRMEFVVREVYRAIKGFTDMIKNGSRSDEMSSSDEKLRDVMLKLPQLYLMDCTLNDCRTIFNSVYWREVYPTLILFPAERNRSLVYEGNMAVTDVIKFVEQHGSHPIHLTGILRTVAEKGRRKSNLGGDAISTFDRVKAAGTKENSHEILLKDRTLESITRFDHLNSHDAERADLAAPHVVAGSVLIATEKIVPQPFSKSQVLIVQADHNVGFIGVIINKRIKWDSLNELADSFETLKEAPLSIGGPLIKRAMPLVAFTRKAISNRYPEVLPGLYFLNQEATSHEIEEIKSGNQSVTDFWFFLGYSSWGWGQLFEEIAEGSWTLGQDNSKKVSWPAN